MQVFPKRAWAMLNNMIKIMQFVWVELTKELLAPTGPLSHFSRTQYSIIPPTELNDVQRNKQKSRKLLD